jgi:hypothetical protein
MPPLLMTLLIVRPRMLRIPLVTFAPLFFAAVLLPLKLNRLYADFNVRTRPFFAMLDDVPIGKTVLVLWPGLWDGAAPHERSGDPSSSAPVYWHFASWPMALKGGYSDYLFDQGIPVRFRERLLSPKPKAAARFSMRMAPAYDYYLAKDLSYRLNSEPALTLIADSGGWTLYQRTSPYALPYNAPMPLAPGWLQH